MPTGTICHLRNARPHASIASTMIRTLRIAPLLVLAVVLAGCDEPRAGAVTPEASVPSEPAASEPAVPESTAAEPSTPGVTPTPRASQADGFAITPDPEADGLFLDRTTCTNPDDGYRVAMPADWVTNTAVGEVGACAWFAPTPFGLDGSSEVPDGVAIVVELVPRDNYTGGSDPDIDAEGLIGQTQPAFRVNGADQYTYVVLLGPPGEGPTLLAWTSPELAGSYELNKAILDRMMSTMELLGSVE
jgi:hypothetical protein